MESTRLHDGPIVRVSEDFADVGSGGDLESRSPGTIQAVSQFAALAALMVPGPATTKAGRRCTVGIMS
jgi:hypothetical protein